MALYVLGLYNYGNVGVMDDYGSIVELSEDEITAISEYAVSGFTH